VIKTSIAGILALLFFISCRKKEEPISLEGFSVAPIPAEAVSQFSGQRAFNHVKNLTDFGPRPPESEGYRKSLAYLETTLHALGWKTKRSSFQSQTPIGRINFTNLIARFSPHHEPDWNVSPPFLVGGHLDSKRYPDKIFLGVNDSGSSTGVMLEMARVLSDHKGAALNVELVFFDGEEAILEDMIFRKDGLYGSTNYAKQLLKRATRPSLGIVIDLVGDPKVNLLIGRDSSPAAIAQTQQAAKTLQLEKEVVLAPGSILDDHVPLIAYAHLPVLHLIGDFQKMPYWHKEGDTLDKITPGALDNCGKLTLQVLHQLTQPKN
jgi:glutaminyl-peptide cyclotransferase